MFGFVRFFRNGRDGGPRVSGAGTVALVDVTTPRPRLVKPVKVKEEKGERRRPDKTTFVRLPDGRGMLGRSDFDPFLGQRI